MAKLRLMRTVLAAALILAAACATTSPLKPAPAATPAGAPAPRPPERLAADAPRATVEGATFVAPAGWTMEVRGPATILTAPEGDSHLALVDVRAEDADAAVAAAWSAYRPGASWPLKVATDAPARDGWTDRREYEYLVSPNQRREVAASAQRSGDVWTVVLHDMAQAVAEKRLAAVQLVLGRLLPKGYARESFAGRTALRLDPARVTRLGEWIELAMRELRIPGVALGLVQDGEVVFTGGYGVRELGRPEAPDGDTLFMIASNTKALTTLLLAKLVDERRLAWDTPATSVLPSFRLGDAETTRQVQVRHLVCACTGLPRQDLEWIFQFEGVTPADALATLATMQPTSKFGEMFQYSNPMAGAAGFAAGHALYPALELGQAYDEAMRTRVFGPLGMAATTFDFARALRGNRALPYAPDVDGRPGQAVMALNSAVIPLRPAGGAWSSVRDLLRYVSMELAEGRLADGRRYVGRAPLLERRAPQVAVGQDSTYGMGLMVDHKHDVTLVRHGGSLFGYYSDMLWLPDHGVGAVVLMNGEPGWVLRTVFRRKLLEVLFDGRPEADAEVAAQARSFYASLAAERRLLAVPAEAALVDGLAGRYASPTLGEIAVQRAGGATTFDFGEWRSEVASRRNPDGTVSFLTIAPSIIGLELVMGSGTPRTLVTRDAQHEYVFTERSTR